LQPVATTRKSRRRKTGTNKPKSLPWVATSCHDERMVRRGSTVRVRQRREVRDERDLAEEFAGTPRRQLLAFARHLGLALEQNEELATPLTLANQHLVRREVDLVRNRGDLAEFAPRQTCEQRYIRDQVDLRGAAHAGRHGTSLTAQVTG